MKRFLCAMALVMSVPGSASSTQLNVRYEVDASALRAAVAGTPLTFSFHDDAGCVTPAIATEVVNVEDLDMVEVLKRFTPKNATKPPKTARIYQTYSISPSRWRYFVSVTGTGVTPVGNACQEQLAAPPTAIAASAPAGVIAVGAGFTPLATLAVNIPTTGTVDLLFETLLNANDVNNYILCAATIDGAGGGVFFLDPGDVDVPIAQYDLSQTHHHTFAVTAGPHTFEVACNLSGGADAQSFGSKLVATFFENAM
jgi:hypothetical protein